MYTKDFSFNWVHPTIHKTIESSGVIITTIYNIKVTNRITVTFYPSAIIFLLYFGIGVGGTHFSKGVALGLRGNYTKRFYKIICHWKNKVKFEYKIDKFIEDLQIPISYTNSKVKKRI